MSKKAEGCIWNTPSVLRYLISREGGMLYEREKVRNCLAERIGRKKSYVESNICSGSSIFNLCICIFLCSAGWMDLSVLIYKIGQKFSGFWQHGF